MLTSVAFNLEPLDKFVAKNIKRDSQKVEGRQQPEILAFSHAGS